MIPSFDPMHAALWCLFGCAIVQALALLVIRRTLIDMSASIDALKTESAASIALMARAVNVINALSGKVANAVDPAEVDAVTAALKAGGASLSAALDAVDPPAPPAA